MCYSLKFYSEVQPLIIPGVCEPHPASFPNKTYGRRERTEKNAKFVVIINGHGDNKRYIFNNVLGSITRDRTTVQKTFWVQYTVFKMVFCSTLRLFFSVSIDENSGIQKKSNNKNKWKKNFTSVFFFSKI